VANNMPRSQNVLQITGEIGSWKLFKVNLERHSFVPTLYQMKQPENLRSPGVSALPNQSNLQRPKLETKKNQG
jgi:hypothetical protein